MTNPTKISHLCNVENGKGIIYSFTKREKQKMEKLKINLTQGLSPLYPYTINQHNNN